VSILYFTATDYRIMVLLLILVAASLALYFIKDLLHAVIVYGAYSLTMALIWLQMNTPDLAITEAAAGICMTVLMMVVIFRTSRREE
jgi:energy-converting hydrogenase B subunit D